MFAMLILAAMQLPGPYDGPPNCKIMYQAAPDEWRFVKVYELSSGEVVLQTVIRGGDSREVYVASPRIRIDSKWAGDVDYKPGAQSQCAKGETIKF